MWHHRIKAWENISRIPPNCQLSNNKLNNILNIEGKQINSEIALECLIEQKYCHWHRIAKGKGKVKQILDLNRHTSAANQSIDT